MLALTPSPSKNTINTDKKKPRNSNLELYRIIVMLLIVAHHYVVNSGLKDVLKEIPLSISSCSMILFGAWGKTGINCFVLITGYFMCKSHFSALKLVKLYLQIIFYAIIIYGIFCVTGHIQFSIISFLWIFWPAKSIYNSDFVSCFLLFYLFIPFLNILLNTLDKRQHKVLMILSVVIFSVFPTIPLVKMEFNYVGWFMVLYIVGSYIRKYGIFRNVPHKIWGWLSLLSIFIGSLSVLCLVLIYKLGYTSIYAPYFFISDSNKIFSLIIAVTSFMYFKDLKIPHSRLINAIGASTFGVLLIHANSDTMRQWLWRETVDCVGHFGSSVIWTLGYATVSVLIIFILCSGIDWFRGTLIEPIIMSKVKKKIQRIESKFK